MDTMEMLKWLPDAEKERYLKFEKTFGTEGWKLIIEWLTAEHGNHLLAAANADAWAENRLSRGRADAIAGILQLENAIINEFVNKADANKADSLEAEEADFEI